MRNLKTSASYGVNARLLSGIVLLSLAIFALDYVTPIGYSVWPLYLIPLALTVRLNKAHFPPIVAAFCTVLVVLGFFFPLPETYQPEAVFRRAIGISMLWFTAVLLLRRIRVDEERFSTAFRAAPVAFGMTSLEDGRIVEVNDAYVQLLGYSREELIGHRAADLDIWASPSDRARMLELLRADGSLPDFATILRTKPGELRHVTLSSSIIAMEGKPHLLATVVDVTERRQVEEKLVKSEAQARAVLESLNEGVVFLDTTGTVVSINDAVTTVLGRSLQELADRESEPRWKLIRSDGSSFPVEEQPSMVALRTGEPVRNVEMGVPSPTGLLKWIAVSAQLVRDTSGKTLGVVASFFDITERKGTEAALRESETRLKEAQHNARIGSWCYRFGGSLTMSDEMYDLYKIPRDVPATYEMVIAAVHPDDRARNHNHFQNALASGACDFQDEYRLVWPDGQVRNIFALGKILRGADGALIEAVGTVQDVTDRKQAEEALRATEERLRLFIEHAPASLAMFDREMRYLSVSRRWLNDYGLGERDLRGLSHYEAFPEIDEAWKAIHRRALDGEVVRNDSDRFERIDGSVQWLRWEVRPWHDAAGVVGGIVVFSEDISERKQAEGEILRLHEELLRHAADLEQHVLDRTAQLEAANKELEAFSYSVSHDLRAPLRAINGFARMLTEDHGPTLDAEGQRLLDVIRGEASRMGRLIDELLQFSRLGRQPLRRSPVDMTAMARKIYDELRAGTPERTVDFRLDSLPSVPADPALLRQVWINLLDNALKFTRQREHAGIVVSGSVYAGEAIYSVRDNGAGFDMKYASKLFGVFQRLHGLEEFEGTGVGLALVQRIVNRHGGRVWAEAALDRGATFSFSLPLPEASPEGAFAGEPSGAEPTNVVQRN